MWVNGASYESYIGRWSRLVARQFLNWLDVSSGAQWLDVGCGTGILSQTILDTASPKMVVGVEPSEEYIEFARKHIQDPRVSFRLGDAQMLPVESASYDAVVSGLVLNFVPQSTQVLTEMVRCVRIGGTVAAYVWDYADQMQLIRYFWNAAVALDKTVLALDEGQRFPLCQPEPLRELFQSNDKLEVVEVHPIVVDTTFRNFDDYWSPFLGGQGPASSYTMSLSEERRVALREHIRLTLPIADDGSIHLIARAWAVRGFRKN
ncbi:MAG: class I SAM-dependent methyltransferase [Nitrososphaeraceae archaeon]